MKNLFLSVIAAIAIFAIYNTISYGSVQDDPKNMKDCSCSACDMKSDDCNNCTGSGCDMTMSEFKKEPMKQSSGTSGDSLESTSAGVCPVSGEPLGDNSISYTYLGKEYKFCCEGCVGKFKKEPMDYTESLQCPVMGGAAKKDVSTVYDGVKYYFCCKGCDKEFMENPEKFMNGNNSEEK